MTLKRISAHEASALMENEAYIYLDVRSVPEFESGHPKGAYNIPLMHMTASGMQPNTTFLDTVKATFEQETKIIVGCKTGRRSQRAAEAMLAEEGYEVVSYYEYGFPAGFAMGFERVLRDTLLHCLDKA